MIKKKIQIEGIPAIIWGVESKRVFIAVHGNGSNKEDTVIELLARQAVANGYQVLSFDLPGHGEYRKRVDMSKVETYINDLNIIMRVAQNRWRKVSLFACSMGTYFSLQAYKEIHLERVLFLSPVVNMLDLIEGMMKGTGVTEQELEKEQTIATPMGMNLYWSYYSYVKAHPITSWDPPTYILYGGKDMMCARYRVEAFAEQFECKLRIDESAEHYFYTKEQLESYIRWLDATI
ncbi:MAG: alpha/beta hydrolase [Cellulosilyticum sp.]|nr:alpha/beta hydrolase [Cellulosilyticum sp.]